MNDQEPKEKPFIENPLQHKNDHQLSRRIIGVEFDQADWNVKVGKGSVREIWQTAPAVAGAVWFVDVIFNDGSAYRIFSPGRIEYAPEPPEQAVFDLGDQSR